MTREEFENNCIQVKPQDNKRPTDEEYKLIEYVYTFHPAISETEGKKQIAYLYMNFGMSIIRDMKARAELMEQKEYQIRLTKATLKKLQEQIEEIREGGDSSAKIKKLVKRAVEEHKSSVIRTNEVWMEGKVEDYWLDNSGALIIQYESGNQWRYKDLDLPFPTWTKVK